jgi:hypothetical protein
MKENNSAGKLDIFEALTARYGPIGRFERIPFPNPKAPETYNLRK